MAGYPAAASAEACAAVSGSACWSRPCDTYVSIVPLPLMPHFGFKPLWMWCHEFARNSQQNGQAQTTQALLWKLGGSGFV